MRITVKTAGVLGQYLPAGGERNLAEIEVAEGTTPSDVMAELGFPTERSYMVILNGTVVPKAERGTRVLAADDELSVLPPLKGG